MDCLTESVQTVVREVRINLQLWLTLACQYRWLSDNINTDNNVTWSCHFPLDFEFIRTTLVSNTKQHSLSSGTVTLSFCISDGRFTIEHDLIRFSVKFDSEQPVCSRIC